MLSTEVFIFFCHERIFRTDEFISVFFFFSFKRKKTERLFIVDLIDG